MRAPVAVNDRFAGSSISVLHGGSRTVLLIGAYAYKLPSLRHGWRSFLRGLLANCQEREWWRSGINEGLCPVTFSLPGGFLVVMARCEPVQDVAAVYDSFVQRGSHVIPVENKDDSFGWLGGDAGHLVAVDYG